MPRHFRLILPAILLVTMMSVPKDANAAWGPWSSWEPTQIPGIEFQTKCDNTSNPDGSGRYEWLLNLHNNTGQTVNVEYVLTPVGLTPSESEWAETNVPSNQSIGGELMGLWWWLDAPCPGNVSVWARVAPY